MLFTEGPALARLEFHSATGDPTTDQFVTSIAKMQQIALRVGFSGRPRVDVYSDSQVERCALRIRRCKTVTCSS